MLTTESPVKKAKKNKDKDEDDDAFFKTEDTANAV
jgi:hypothetical protein